MKTRNRIRSALKAAGRVILAGLLLTTATLPRAALSANFFGGVSPTNVAWPAGIVPYVFETNVTSPQQAVYLAGLKEWELAANVRFVPWTNQPRYVLLQLLIDGSGTGEYLDGSPATMRLHSLSRGVICHEAGHLLGLQHEHQRTNRDDYIAVDFANILPAATNEFIIDTNSVPYGAYDLESVMHYNRHVFTAGTNLDSLDPLPAYQNYSNRLGNLALSVNDRAAAAYLYGPRVTPLTNLVTATADIGPGSLRAAIYYANDHPGTTIRFCISTNDPGYTNGVFTIYLAGELPPLVAPGTIVDGATQPGYTNRPVIALDGSQVYWAAGEISGLHLYTSNCLVRALALNHFADSGIQLQSSDTAGNRVEGCFIGISPNGTNAAPNAFRGVNLTDGAHDNLIGGTNTLQQNVISGNSQYGILITTPGADRNAVLGNLIGVDASGAEALPNGLSGIGSWAGASGTIIGRANARNVISGNGQYGVFLGDPTTAGIVIRGNYIGTDATGAAPLANQLGGVGVFLGAHSVAIGGTNAGDGNVISGNGNAGIWLSGGGVSNNLIQGNYLGLNAAGDGVVSNGWTGIYLLNGASGNLIGGTGVSAGNVISGNISEGIFISGPGTMGNVIQGNRIGTGPQGTNAFRNGDVGIGIWSGASGNLIGGGGAGAGNLISGNGGYGVAIAGPNTTDNVIQGNVIGADVGRTNSLANAFAGVALWGGARRNRIGDTNTGAGNLIAWSGSDGIAVYDAETTNNTFRGNALFNNSGLGINLAGGTEDSFGVTDNDPSDLDSGPNNLQNFPLLSEASGAAGITTLRGTLNSTPDRTFWIDLYRSDSANPSGHGEGQIYFATIPVETDSNGDGNFSLNAPGDFSGHYLAATATDAGTGDTSEFGLAILTTNGPIPVMSIESPEVRSNGFSFSINVETNRSYRVQTTADLGADPVVWLDLTNFFAVSPSLLFTDQGATNAPRRFYRVVTP